MAGLTTAALVTGGLAIGQGAYKLATEGKKEREAKRDLRNLPVPELDNAYEMMPIADSGLDFVKEQSQVATASAIDALRAGGVPGVMSALPKIVAQNNQMNLEGRKYIDDQIIDRNYAIAREEGRNKYLREQRYREDVAGLGNQIATAEENKWNAIRGIGNGLSYMGSTLTGTIGGNSGSV